MKSSSILFYIFSPSFTLQCYNMQVMFSTDGYACPETFYLGLLITLPGVWFCRIIL